MAIGLVAGAGRFKRHHGVDSAGVFTDLDDSFGAIVLQLEPTEEVDRSGEKPGLWWGCISSLVGALAERRYVVCVIDRNSLSMSDRRIHRKIRGKGTWCWVASEAYDELIQHVIQSVDWQYGNWRPLIMVNAPEDDLTQVLEGISRIGRKPLRSEDWNRLGVEAVVNPGVDGDYLFVAVRKGGIDHVLQIVREIGSASQIRMRESGSFEFLWPAM